MKARNTLALWILAVSLCACGGGSSGRDSGGVSMSPPPAPMPPPVQTGNYTVDSLVPLAKAGSESDDPLSVDSGSVTLGPTDDETSDPIALN
jgi:hypothetical protein